MTALSSVHSAVESNRKFAVFCLVFGSIVLLLLFDKLDGDNFKDIAIAVVGLYMAGNVGEHFARREQYVSEVTHTSTPPGWGES